MRINPLGSSVAVAPAGGRRPANDLHPHHETLSSGGMPVERVIEGELLNKRPVPTAGDVARLWPFGAERAGGAPGVGDLYATRASAAISRYLDTAFMSAARAEARAALDLYA
ncbi:MAG: hypothetical protein IPM20_11815 [Gammaproteobacteria bacterium]|nr:hypothetical protein [Gammaproteobacteria bacterium]